MSRLLFLTQRIPYPPIKGEKIRPLQILKHLRRRHEVHLGCLIDDPADRAHVETVRGMCADAHFATLDRRLAKATCGRGVLTGEPLSVTYFRDAGLQRWVDRTMARVRPDVVFVCSGNMAPYVLHHADATGCLLVDLADVDSEKWRAYAAEARGPMRWVYAREAEKVAALERRIAVIADWSTFVTEAEAALFRRMVPNNAARVHAVRSGIDHAYFDPAGRHAPPFDPARPNFVFTGTMDYPPNVDAVCWFAREILPLVRTSLPDAAFWVVGASPAPAVQRLASLDGVAVTGRVPDVRPYLAHAAACVAPVRIARGIQNKVLEAMAMGRPTVVTPQALEGIDAEPGRDLLLAGDAASFAAAAVAAARGPDRGELGAAARRLVVERFGWSATLPAFDRLIATARGGRPAEPLADAAGF